MQNSIWVQIFTLMISSTLVALPQQGEVAAGQADFSPGDPSSLKITTSNKAIINFQKFNIGEGEHVEFVQPSRKSIVLNRVKGGDPSKLLGKLSANGRVFLVNPNGIYIGPKATVNAASFLASTFNIRDEDFLNDKYHFFLEPGTEKAQIINEGTIAASPEGFVAFFAPIIQNHGTILARAEKIILASAERVTLDLAGDGLIQFAVDGELEEALIANYGTIESARGSVELSMRTAQKAIKMVVNTDGAIAAAGIEEVGGVIHLVAGSYIAADTAHIDSGPHARVVAEGTIDASNRRKNEKGGEVHLLGDYVHLKGAQIDVSGDAGGGVVLIGGDYQGKGNIRPALETVFDAETCVFADALRIGDGGKVIVWADGATYFNGKIYARGGLEGGDGGFVETSGKIGLDVQTGFVDTSAPHGKFGEWLLDPGLVIIATGGGAALADVSSPNCGTGGPFTIDPTAFTGSASNVAICAQNASNSVIEIESPIAMTTPGVGLTLTAGTGAPSGGLILFINGSITTKGGAIALNGVVTLEESVTLDTTNGGGSPAGGNITFSNTVDGNQILTLTGGTSGVVTLTGAVGGATPILTLTATGATITQSSTAATVGGALSYTGTTAINIGGNVTTAGNAITMTGPVVVSGSPTFDSTDAGGAPAGANINFTSTLNGGAPVSIRAGTGGTVTFSGAVGGVTPLSSLSATAATITQSSSAKTTGAFSYIGTTAINIGGSNVTTSGGAITMTGPVVASGFPTSFDSTNLGGTPAGANIDFTSTLNGATPVAITAGTGGTITFGGAVGNTAPPIDLSFISANLIQIGSNITVSASSLGFPCPVSLIGTSVITSNLNAVINFSTILNGAQALTIVAGTGGAQFSDAVGGTTPLTSLTVTAKNITQSSTVRTTGALSYTASVFSNINGNITTSGGSITMAGLVDITNTPITFDTTNAGASSSGANISFSNTLDGATALTLRAGTGGTVSFTGAVGGITPLTNLSFTSAALIQIGNNITMTGANPLTFPSPVSLTGTSNITSNNANISFNSTLNGAQALTLTGGTGITTFTGAVGGTTPVGSLAATAATITQSSTARTTGALSYTGSTAINVNGNITTSGGIITMTGPVSLTTSPTFDTTNGGGTSAGANISFSSTLDGAQSLVLKGGTAGVVTLSGAVGSLTPLSSLTIFSTASIIQSSTVTTTGQVAYFGSTAVSINGNITTSGQAIGVQGAITIAGNPTFDTTNNGGTPAGASISFSNGTINGATVLTLRAGTGGTISFGDSIGATTPLTNLVFTSAGLIQIGSITVSGANPLIFPSPVNLIGTSNITSTNANISFNSTVDGAGQVLTLTGGTGVITLTGAVGGTTPPASLTISSAANVTANAISAGSITQSAGTGTTTFNGAVSTTGASGILLTGTNFTINADITTTNSGPLSITHSGLLTIANGLILSIDGAFTDSGTGTTTLAGTLTTNGQNISFGPPVTLGGVTSLNTGAGTGNILFSSTVNGSQNLTLNVGNGNITFTGAVGALTRLGTVTVDSTNNFTANALTLGTFNQSAGTGITTFNGAVDLNTVTGLSITATNVTFNNTLNTTNTGPANLTVSGTLVLSSPAVFTLTGPFTQSGTGSVQSAGSITTTNQNIQFGSAVTLTGATALSTGGGSIIFANTVDGAGSLALTAGTGNITFDSAVGSLTRLGALTINSATNISALGIKAVSINQAGASGTSLYAGDFNTNGAAGVQLTGNLFSINGNLITSGGGPFTITNSGHLTLVAGNSTSLSSTFTQNGTGAAQFSGILLTNNAAISFASPMILSGASTLNSGVGAGSITLSSTVDGAETLTLSSGTGNTTLGGDLGDSVPLTDILINHAGVVSTQKITASSFTQASGSVSTTFNGAVQTSTATGISLTGTAFTFDNNVTTTGGGPLTVNNSALLSFASGTVGTIAGAFSQTTAGGVSLAGSITTGGIISIAGPITIAGTATLSTAAASQNITLSNTVDGSNNLTIAAGGGSLTISGAVGSITPLGTLTISSADNVSTQGITAASIVQSAGTGTTTLTGNLNTSAIGGINLTGAAFTLNGSVITTASGPFLIHHTAPSSLTFGASTLLSGPFTESGAGAISLAGTLHASDSNITFANAILLTQGATLNSDGGGDILISSTVDGDQNLNLTAGTGNITISAAIGGTTPINALTINSANNVTTQAISAASITQLEGSGTSTFNGNLTTSGAAGIALTGNNITQNGSVTTTGGGAFTVTNSGLFIGGAATVSGAYLQNGTGAVQIAGTITTNTSSITLDGATTLTGPATFDSSAGSGNITFGSTIDSGGTPEPLTLNAASGNIAISGAVGSISSLGVLTIQSADNLTFSSSVAASSMAASSMTGTALFNGTVATSASAGIVLSGNALTFNQNVTTSAGGVMTVTNSGLFTIANGKTFSLSGAFTQNGAGSVSSGGSITTANGAISFASALTLTAPVALNSGAGGSNITLDGAVDGAQTFTLTAGAGNIDLQGTIGQTTPLTGMTIPSAATILVNANATMAGPLTITSATGPTTFNGTVTATAMNLTGTAVTFNNTVTTTTGSIAIANSGTLTVPSTAPISASTSFTQTGSGGVSLGANITTAGALSIASSITFTHGVIFNSGGGNITLSNGGGGAFDVTLTAGAGDIMIGGDLGSPRIGVFTITSAQDVVVQSITAASVTQLSGSGTSTLNGDLDTNTASGITLTGNNFIGNGTINTTNGGPLTVTNSGLLTGTGSSMVTLNGGGAFTQNGTGLVNLGGTVTTQNATISHTSPVAVLIAATFTSNGGNIVFMNTVNGPACLTTDAGTGNVQFEAPVGAITPLGCLTATGAQIFQTSSLQSTGAVNETTTVGSFVGGNITTNGSDITFTGNLVTQTSLEISTGGGAGNISVSGTVNGSTAGQNLTLETTTGNITLSGSTGSGTPFNNLTLGADNITWGNLGSPGTGVTGTTSVTATANINFTGTSYNGSNQTYTAGALSNFNFTAGVATSVSSNASPITFASGTIQLNNDLTLNSSGATITMGDLLGTGFNFTVNAGVGAYNFMQIGALGQDLNDVTLTSNHFTPTPVLGTNVFAASLNVNSSTPVTISSNQTITNLTYNSPVIFQGNIQYTCGTSGTITFNDTVDANTAGVDTLSFDFSTCPGSVIFNAPIGSVAPLASLSVNAAIDVMVNSTIDVGAFSVTNGTGTTTLQSGITSTAVGGIAITTPTINLAGSITTASGGGVVLDNSGALTVTPGASFGISGSFQQTGAGSVSISGTIATDDAAIEFTGPVTLSGNMTLSSMVATGGDISFASTIQGTSSIVLTAGSGDITFGGGVGLLATPVHDLQIISARNVTASSSIFAHTLTQFAGTALTTFDGTLSTIDVGGIQLTGSAFTFDNNVTTTNGGPVIITNSGALTVSSATYSIAGAWTQNGTGSSTIAGTITTGGAISFARGVTLSGTTALDASSNSQNITFSSTLTNDLVTAHNLTLNAGGGNILFSGSVGTTPIGALVISNAKNVTAGAISASSISQVAGTGMTTITGNLATSGVLGINLVGTNFNINDTVTTTNGGPFSLTNTGPLSLTLGNGTMIGGSFTQSGGGAVSLAGTIATSNQNISFANAITLAGSTVLSSGPGAGTITLSNTVDGGQTLSLTAGTGNIIFGGNLGATTPLGNLVVNTVQNITYPIVNASSIVQAASTGTTTITGPLSTTGASGVSIMGGVINQMGSITTTGGGPVLLINTGTLTIAGATTASGSYTQSGGGSVNLGAAVATTNNTISFANPVTLTADVAVHSGPINGNITFTATIQGAHSLTIHADAGTITLGGNVGGITPLTSLVLDKAGNISTQGIIAGSITQNMGTGTTTFNGALLASGATGITLQGTAFTFNNTVTTSSGPLVLTNSGLATFNAAAVGSISGALTQNGAGTVQLSSSITAGGVVTFSAPVLTSGTASLDTHVASEPITFLSTVDGPGNLTLATGTNDITFSANAGSIASLGALQITTARNVTTAGITAASIVQTAGTGTTTLTGNLNTSGASGINLTGAAFTLNGSVITTASGPFLLNHSAPSSLTFGSSTLLSGPFTETGSGAISLAGILHASNSNISFANPITLTQTTTLNSDGGGDILISNTVDGNQTLNLTAGTGNITISAIIGGITPINSMTINSANNVSAQAVSAGFITQVAGSGLTTFNGTLATTNMNGINLTGSQFTFDSPVGTLGSGPVQVTNTGLLTLSATAPMTLTGSFSQLGIGAVSLCDTITTSGAAILFTGPVTLCNTVSLSTSGAATNITFLNTITGVQNLSLQAGLGDITFAQNVGPLGAFQVTNEKIFTSQSITATSILLSGVSMAATVSGNLTTSGPSGITLSGAAFTLNGNETTTGGGPFTATNSGLLTFASNAVLSIDGPFLQNGTGHVTGGGSLTTNNQPIQFQARYDLTGNLAISAGSTGADITIEEIEGSFNLTLDAQAGDVTINQVIGDATPLVNFTVTSAHDINLNGVGTATAGVTGALTLNASNNINLANTVYTANTQAYSAGSDINFNAGAQTNLTSFGTPIAFTSGMAILSMSNDLNVITNNGTFSFVSIVGTSFENIMINTGTGLAALSAIHSLGTINNFFVNAGQVTFSAPIDPVNVNIVSLGAISNTGAPVLITSVNTSNFNALGGNVGSLTSPILVNSSNQIFAGAGGSSRSLADFDGTSIDNTVHPIPSNPPCTLIFNGVVLQDCAPAPIPPAPPVVVIIPSFPFAVPGMDSSYFNLASDYFFKSYFFDDTYLRKETAVYYR